MSRLRTTQDTVEVLASNSDGAARVSQSVVEVLQAYTAGSAPAGSFGVAMSQRVVEALVTGPFQARVATRWIEVLFTDGTESSSGGGGPHSFGYAV